MCFTLSTTRINDGDSSESPSPRILSSYTKWLKVRVEWKKAYGKGGYIALFYPSTVSGQG